MCELGVSAVTNNNVQSINNNPQSPTTPHNNTSSAKRRSSSRLSEIPKPVYYGPNPQSPTTTSAKRRSSSCLSEIPDSKRPYYGPNPQSLNNKEEITPPPIISTATPDSTLSKHTSSRLSEIPESKRPYYGPNPQSPTTPPPHDHNVTTSTSAKKRTSSRLSQIPQPYYGPNPQSPKTPPVAPPHNNNVTTSTSAKRRTSLRLSKIPRPYYGPTTPPPPLSNTTTVETISSTETSNTTASADLTITNQQQQSRSTRSIGAFEYVPHSADDIAKVKATLRIYNKHFLHFVQNEDAKVKTTLRTIISIGNVFVRRHSKKTGSEKKQVRHPDFIAVSQMRNSKEILFPRKRPGHLPGIDVGYQFYSRAEMVAVRLHSHLLYDIDYIGYSSKAEFKSYKFPLAVAIVCSGQYEDDEDNREEIEYTGQGGNDFHGTKRQIKNQEMSRGNLALKNCMEQSIPVRFIRGIPGDRSFHGDNKRFKLYTYDGLYKVDSYQLDEGKSGFAVYKFRLKRLEGQPKLTSNKVQYNKYNNKRISSVPKLVSLDITGGQEKLHIPVINSIDDTIITGFTYTKSIQVPPGMKLPPNAAGCKCKGNCTNPKTCACAKLNGGDFPYVQDSGGRLIEAKDVVFECGPNCGCGPGCINRISQREINYQLEVFRTSNRGWAVKTKDVIPSGAPVCEYIGQLRRQSEMDKVDNNEYIFEIDCEQTIKEIGGRERRLGAVSGSVVGNKTKDVAADEKESILSEPEFCIEAGSVGNVARFINHSCDPNLFVQCVVSSHHDLRLARIILVASDNIPPNQELTYDYGYALDSVVDENGNVKKLTCHCGTSLCRGRLY